MCGIFFSCSPEQHRPPSDTLLNDLRRRGPDGANSVTTSVAPDISASRNSGSEMQKPAYLLTFLSTVLSLRGNSVVGQPLKDLESGSLLCWNGEAWKVGGQNVQGNDAEHVFDLFLGATRRHSDNADNTLTEHDHSLQSVVEMLSSITGPYAFVFYDAQHHRVFYGRDALGRRSLLMRQYSTTTIVLSSICDSAEPENWIEVEADGIYVYDMNADMDLSHDIDGITHIPWVVDDSKSVLYRTLVPHSPLLLMVLKELTSRIAFSISKIQFRNTSLSNPRPAAGFCSPERPLPPPSTITIPSYPRYCFTAVPVGGTSPCRCAIFWGSRLHRFGSYYPRYFPAGASH